MMIEKTANVTGVRGVSRERMRGGPKHVEGIRESQERKEDERKGQGISQRSFIIHQTAASTLLHLSAFMCFFFFSFFFFFMFANSVLCSIAFFTTHFHFSFSSLVPFFFLEFHQFPAR